MAWYLLPWLTTHQVTIGPSGESITILLPTPDLGNVLPRGKGMVSMVIAVVKPPGRP